MIKVRNIELINSLKSTLEQNTKAIDYVENCKNRVKDLLNYNPDDVISAEELRNLEYICFSLRYLDKQYMSALKKNGGNV